jgi:hypothetical protein
MRNARAMLAIATASLLIAASCVRQAADTAPADRATTDVSPAMPATSTPTNPTPEPAEAPRPHQESGTSIAQPITDDAPIAVQNPPEIITLDQFDKACHSDADCAIKDVGSCCGYNPRCVNKDTPTFPEQVKAKCSKEGRASICGFPSLSGCKCEQGTCAGISDGTQVQ